MSTGIKTPLPPGFAWLHDSNCCALLFKDEVLVEIAPMRHPTGPWLAKVVGNGLEPAQVITISMERCMGWTWRWAKDHRTILTRRAESSSAESIQNDGDPTGESPQQ